MYDRLGTVIERNGNPYNNILPLVPELGRVFGHPRVAGALASILGDDYYLHMHRHCHDRAPGSEAQRLHKDSLYNSRYAVDGNRRHHHARWVMAFYYPQDTGEEMGPTAIVPRSQYLLQQQREEDEIHLTGAAGTVIIVHYDIWHRAAGTVNAARNRYMVKFLFTRMSDPEQPSWRHDPGAGAPVWERSGAAGGAGDERRPELPEVWGHQWRWHLGGAGAAPVRRRRRTASWPRCSRRWPEKTRAPPCRRPIAWGAAVRTPRNRWPRRCAAPTNRCAAMPPTRSRRSVRRPCRR